MPNEELFVPIKSLIGNLLPGVKAGYQSLQQGSTEPYRRFLSETNQRLTTPEGIVEAAINFGPGAFAGILKKTITDKATKAFLKSANQKIIGKIGNAEVVLGSFGDNAISRKIAGGQPDRLVKEEIPNTLQFIKNSFRAGDSSFRKDNLVHIAEMPNGERRALITRFNENGKEEVINFFKIGRDYEKFVKKLESFGVPSQSRTGISNLEGSQSNPLTYRDKNSISNIDNKTSPEGDNQNVLYNKDDLAFAAVPFLKTNQRDKEYYVRNNTITQPDIEKAKKIIFSEISNRPIEKQELETRVLLNTAFNRMDEYRKQGKELSLAEVITQPNQYQGYNTPLYKRYGETATDTPTKTRKENVNKIVNKILKEIEQGTFQDNTRGAFYYSHKDDKIYYDDRRPLFKTSRNKVEPLFVSTQNGR